MARIRTVKPEFFRHEALQDLERDHGDLKPMLVFEGLWTTCDKNGIFEWKPRQLKLDILPFLDFSMADTLALLLQKGFLISYSSDGKLYGQIPTFRDHQRITGKEATSPGRYPEPTKETTEKHQGNIREATEQQQGAQEREKEREREKEAEREYEGKQTAPGNGNHKGAFLKIQDVMTRIQKRNPDQKWLHEVMLFIQCNTKSNPDALVHCLESLLKAPGEILKPKAYLDAAMKIENGKYNAAESEQISNAHKTAPINLGAMIQGIGKPMS